MNEALLFISYALPQQSIGAPKQRRLSMQITNVTFAIKIILTIVFLVGAFTYIANIAILVDVSDERQPGLACRRTIGSRIEPAFFYTGDKRKCKHASAGSFFP